MSYWVSDIIAKQDSYMSMHNLIIDENNIALFWQKEASDKSEISCKREKCVCHFYWRHWNIMMSYTEHIS